MLHTHVWCGTFFMCLFMGIHWSEYHAVKVQFINFIILEQYKRGEEKSINRFGSIQWLVTAALSLQNKALLDLLLCRASKMKNYKLHASTLRELARPCFSSFSNLLSATDTQGKV